MPTLKPDHITPTDAEEADIQVQIAEDPEDSAHWENSTPPQPAAEVVPHIVEGFRRVRGRQISPTKVSINIRLAADVVASLRESGRGWQTRVNDILRKAIIG